MLKKIVNYAVISFLLLSTFPVFLHAEEKSWKDTAELSFVRTGGNTDILTFSAKNTLEYRFSEQWSTAWDFGLLYGETDGEKNAERYSSDLRIDYTVSKSLYCFALGGWEKDEFSGLHKRIYLGPGIGYKFLTGERHFLSTEAGLNYAKETYTDNTDKSFLEGRLQGKYEYVFSPDTKFSQSVKYLHNLEDTEKYRINTVSGITTQLNKIFSLKISYEVNYQNQPSPDTLEKTDTRLSVALVANF